jgi:hypothetical protein
MPRKTKYYNLVVTEWQSSFVGGKKATAVTFTRETPGFWPWSRPSITQHSAVRGYYEPFFRDEATGKLISDDIAEDDIEGLISIEEAKKNAP